MSKKLPRTSQRTLNDLRNAAKEALDAEMAAGATIAEAPKADAAQMPGQPPEMAPQPPTGAPPPRAGQTESKPASAAKAPVRKSASSKAVSPRTRGSEITVNKAPTKRAVGKAAGRAVVTARPATIDKAAFREASGRMIVERHANLAAVTGLIPLPWVDLAAITAIVDRMFRKLARLYGVRLEGERSRQLATAMLTGVAVPAIASFTTTTLFQLTVGQNLIGSALTCISAAVIVRMVGETYLTHLASVSGMGAGTIRDQAAAGA